MNKIKDGIGLTFDDVLIEPKISEIESRRKPDVSSRLGEHIWLQTPVIASCMDTVSEVDMAVAMARAGGLAILHRFVEPHIQAKWFGQLEHYAAGAAVGVSDDDKERVDVLYNAGCRLICVDVANGQSIYAARFIYWLRGIYPDVTIMAGNVATSEGVKYLEGAGADILRVGIGGGSFCTTRTTTGIGVPQLTSLLECAEVASVPLVADGGIRRPSDVAKALGAGAKAVMLGGLLVGTAESPGAIYLDEERPYKMGRGMASLSAQVERPGNEGKDLSKIVPEGISAKVPYIGGVKQVIDNLMGGLRSAMSYTNSLNLNEFRDNVEFIRISNASLVESHPHILDY